MVSRSKLEKNIDILKTLASREPLHMAQIANKTNINRNALRRCLQFLVQQDLVARAQMSSKNRVSYGITERGLRVLNAVVPIIEEARKIPALLH